MSWNNDIVLRDVSNACLAITDCIGRVVSTQIDLEESLEASIETSHAYATHPKEWPPLVEVVDTWDLPSILTERYNAAGGEGTSLCGIFPEIHRAWASVDNSLFLWRYDKWNDDCHEYSRDDQPICTVGLAKAKPDIFTEAIKYLLVLATPVELILVGVCCSGRSDGMDPYAEILLQLFPEYRVPSDGVTMTCITSTNGGRIFLAGCDGQIYELLYTTGSGWKKCCRKVCVTAAGLRSVISRWAVPSVFKFGGVDPIIEMVVDNERHTLYTRTEKMKIQVFFLGLNGNDTLKKIAEERDLVNLKERSIVSISPLSIFESKWLYLVAVLSDGRRLYISSTSSSRINGNNHKPTCLKVVTTRPSPFGPISLAGRSQDEEPSLKIESAYYSAGTLILSDSSASTTSSLLIVSKDSSTKSPSTRNFGIRALRESVSSLPGGGRMLFMADILLLSDAAASMQSLYSQLEFCGFDNIWKDSEKESGKLWARGDLSTQHILPRRRMIVFSTMKMLELVFNRPVDILRKLLESNLCRSTLEDFFNRFGAGESAAMCLMLAAKIVHTENIISNLVAEKAAEAFEDPRLVQMPSLEGSGALSNTRAATGGFSMGHVVQHAEPALSGAYEGLCLCTSRLLLPLWNLPIVVTKGSSSSGAMTENGIIACRLSFGAMRILEDKIRSLERFLNSRRLMRRGLYGCVVELGDVSELAALEVRAMECIRQLLLRSAQALFLLQLVSQHHPTRLVQNFDATLKQALVQLTFHQLVGTEEGNLLATRLISALIEYYTGSNDRGTGDDITTRLSDGCPSYYKDPDYKFCLAEECIERASMSLDAKERQKLAGEAFNYLSNIPESADLRTVCKRFEDLRFYEAVVRLPLQKAQALDPAGDAYNEQIHVGLRERALVQREQCYEIITSALRSLKGGTSYRHVALDPASRKKYIYQIFQLGIQSADRVFHEYLYRTLIDLGLENELLEYGGPDLALFLQNALREPVQEVRDISAVAPSARVLGYSRTHYQTNHVKYSELLARYYVLKRQHALATHVLLRLAERFGDGAEEPTLEQRCQYLSSAVLQAKSARDILDVSNHGAYDDGLLDLVKGKFVVLKLQMKIKEKLEAIASNIEAYPSSFVSTLNDDNRLVGPNILHSVREVVKELSTDLKSITQLYNEYAVPFEIWEVCLEILYFANCSVDTDNCTVNETWARLLDQNLSKGGVAEACAVLKRVGSHVYSIDGAVLPLDTLCLHLEKAALERSTSGVESVGEEDVARALLAACKGSVEPVLNTYNQLLSNGVGLQSASLRLRLLCSVLVVLRQWVMSIFAQSAFLPPEQTTVVDQVTRDKITRVANRYMEEMRMSPLSLNQTGGALYHGFKELAESVLSPFPDKRFY